MTKLFMLLTKLFMLLIKYCMIFIRTIRTTNINSWIALYKALNTSLKRWNAWNTSCITWRNTWVNGKWKIIQRCRSARVSSRLKTMENDGKRQKTTESNRKRLKAIESNRKLQKAWKQRQKKFKTKETSTCVLLWNH